MARIFRDGFDAYNGSGGDTGLASYYSVLQDNGGSLTAGRFGGQALRTTRVTNSSQNNLVRNLDAAVSAFAVGFAFRVDQFNTLLSPSNGGSHLQLFNGSTYQLGLKLIDSGAIQVVRHINNSSITVLGTSSAVILANDWNYIEWEGVISDASGTSRLFLNGDPTPILNLSAIDTNVTGGIVDRIGFGNSTMQSGGTAPNLDFDDAYVEDTDTRLGPQKITTLRLTGNGAHQDSTPSTGTDRAALLDETTVASTDYVSMSSVGQYDEYALGDLSFVPDSIQEVNMMGWMQSTDVASRALALGVDSGGTVNDGANHFLTNSLKKFNTPRALNPNGSVAWTQASVNALVPRPIVTV